MTSCIFSVIGRASSFWYDGLSSLSFGLQGFDCAQLVSISFLFQALCLNYLRINIIDWLEHSWPAAVLCQHGVEPSVFFPRFISLHQCICLVTWNMIFSFCIVEVPNFLSKKWKNVPYLILNCSTLVEPTLSSCPLIENNSEFSLFGKARQAGKRVPPTLFSPFLLSFDFGSATVQVGYCPYDKPAHRGVSAYCDRVQRFIPVRVRTSRVLLAKNHSTSTSLQYRTKPNESAEAPWIITITASKQNRGTVVEFQV